MKKIRMLPVLFLILAVGSGPAFAQRHGGEYHGWHHGGEYRGHGDGGIGLALGLGLGLAYLLSAPSYYTPAPSYYPPYAYPLGTYNYPPVVVAPSQQRYIEREPDQPPAQSQASDDRGAWWYYCSESKAYYPYVRDCPGGWQRVSPAPPSE